MVVDRFDLLGEPRSTPTAVDIDVVVRCSSGTYVRALARDLGALLGSAGHLTALRRAAIGSIGVDQCSPLTDQAPPVVAAEVVIGDIMPALHPADEQIDALRNGRRLTLAVPDDTYLVLDADGSWVSVIRVENGECRIEVNAPS